MKFQRKLELPIITGYATKEEDIQLGERLCTEDLQKLDDILQIMKAAESNEIANIVTKINISDKQDYVLELKSEKKTVHVGDTSNLSTKMLYIKEIIEQNNGCIDIKSELGKGTEVVIRIPAVKKRNRK